MKRIVFNGCWVGTNVVGVSRYAYNIIKLSGLVMTKLFVN